MYVYEASDTVMSNAIFLSLPKKIKLRRGNLNHLCKLFSLLSYEKGIFLEYEVCNYSSSIVKKEIYIDDTVNI